MSDVLATKPLNRGHFGNDIAHTHTYTQSNNEQTPGQFDREYVSGQIQQLAVFETVDLVQTGS